MSLKNALAVVLASSLLACGGKTSSILPDAELSYLSGYHCWPYDASIYSTGGLEFDPSWLSYPLDDFFSTGGKYTITHWTDYAAIDTALWNGMDSTLSECVGNNELHRSLLNGDPVYFSGMYRNMIVANGGKKRKYAQILFLDLRNQRLHMFKDINKVF